MSRLSIVRIALGVASGLVLAWTIGFFGFVATVQKWEEPSSPPAASESADTIIVLTGGRERVETGLDLLKNGYGKKLLISGVHPGLTLDHLLANAGVSADMRACCITLGHAASSTFGNAEETRAWLAQEGYHSLRLVTANYHMPRSLIIFRAALPEATILPYPVAPDKVRLDGWWEHPGTLRLLVMEYDTYLWALLRVGAGE